MSQAKRFYMPALRRQLCGHDKMPLEFSGLFENILVWPPAPFDRYYAGGLFTFKVLPSTPTTRRKSSQHRIFVKCPQCGQFIPAGRIAQHIGTKNCKALAAKVKLKGSN